MTIPTSVTNILEGAFRGCNSLASVTIPNSITEIGGVAFYSCTKLTSITIPSSVTAIGYETFYDCNALKVAFFMGNAPTMASSVFGATASGFKAYYMDVTTGFTTPTWNGYPAFPYAATQYTSDAPPALVFIHK